MFGDDHPEMTPRGNRRRRIGLTLVVVALFGALILSFAPTPYVIEQPGPVFDTLGDVQVSGKQVPLIAIPGEMLYPTTGALRMLTVSVVGNRDEHPSWLDVVTAWADPSRAVVPVDAVYPVGESVKQSNEQSAIDMQNSQKEAVAAALGDLGYTFGSTLTVAGFSHDSPAEKVLKTGDHIVTINGKTPADVTQLRSFIAENGTQKAAEIGIVRDGVSSTVEVTPFTPTGSGFTADSKPIVGISVGSDYNFPIDVKIQLDNVGGPSAGMMFALGIIDKLTPGSLTGGADVAGTGTISSDGTVGPIGGIRQKLYGASRAGADYFLAPRDNCGEVGGHIPAGLEVFAVSKLGDSLAVLKAIDSGSKAALAALATCDTASASR